MPCRELESHITGTGRQVVAGLLRDWSCSIVLGGANCNGRHAELVNKIKGPQFNTPTTNQEVGSSNLSGRANLHAISVQNN